MEDRLWHFAGRTLQSIVEQFYSSIVKVSRAKVMTMEHSILASRAGESSLSKASLKFFRVKKSENG
jgi:hypothetical protein